MPGRDVGRARSAGRRRPARRGPRRPAAAGRPPRRSRRTWSCSSSRRSTRASGPTSVASSQRVAHALAPPSARRTGRSNSSRTASTTMKRLAAMQLWPALMQPARRRRSRPARSRSASSRIDVGVAAAELEHGLLQRLARPAPPRPGRPGVLPVSVTAATRGCSMIARRLAAADQQGAEEVLAGSRRRGRPPRSPGRSRARCEACLSSAGVAGHQRRCGEAEDLPEGEVPRHDRQHDAERLGSVTKLRVASVSTGSAREEAPPRARRSSRRPRRTSRPRPRPCATGLPISPVIRRGVAGRRAPAGCGGCPQQRCPFGERHAAPRHLCGVGVLEGGFDLRRVPLLVAADDLARGGVDALDRHGSSVTTVPIRDAFRGECLRPPGLPRRRRNSDRRRPHGFG